MKTLSLTIKSFLMRLNNLRTQVFTVGHALAFILGLGLYNTLLCLIRVVQEAMGLKRLSLLFREIWLSCFERCWTELLTVPFLGIGFLTIVLLAFVLCLVLPVREALIDQTSPLSFREKWLSHFNILKRRTFTWRFVRFFFSISTLGFFFVCLMMSSEDALCSKDSTSLKTTAEITSYKNKQSGRKQP